MTIPRLLTSGHVAGGTAFHRPVRSVHGIAMPAWLLPEGEHTDPPGGKPDGDPAADKGFPDNTPLTEMTVEQQAAYWKHQSRKHEARASERSDYDDLKAKAEAYDKAKREALPEQERLVAEAKAAAKAEGLAEGTRAASTGAVKAILQATLTTRGKTAEQVESLLKHINFETFVTDGAPDTAAIIAHADSIAGPVTGGGNGGRGPDHGQGQRGTGNKATGVSAGAEMFAAGSGKK